MSSIPAAAAAEGGNSSSGELSIGWSMGDAPEFAVPVVDPSYEPMPLFDSNEEEEENSSELAAVSLPVDTDDTSHHTDKNFATSNNEGGVTRIRDPSPPEDDIPSVTRRKKKPKGMPKRPLSAYNLFFQRERPKLLEQAAAGEDGKRLSFEELGRIIGKKWRALSAAEREEYENYAQQDSCRYRGEMESFYEEKKKRIADMDKIDDDIPATASATAASSSTRDSTLSPLQLSSHSARSQGGHPYHLAPSTSSSSDLRLPAFFPNMAASHQHPNYQRGHEQHHHHGPPGGHPMPPYYPPQTLPASARSATPSIDPNLFPIPPGMELMLPDREGRDRKYRVQYTCYTMSREAAQQYMERMSGQMPLYAPSSSSYHHPPPPPPPRHPHHPGTPRSAPPPPPPHHSPPHGVPRPPPKYPPGAWGGGY